MSSLEGKQALNLFREHFHCVWLFDQSSFVWYAVAQHLPFLSNWIFLGSGFGCGLGEASLNVEIVKDLIFARQNSFNFPVTSGQII